MHSRHFVVTCFRRHFGTGDTMPAGPVSAVSLISCLGHGVKAHGREWAIDLPRSHWRRRIAKQLGAELLESRGFEEHGPEMGECPHFRSRTGLEPTGQNR